MPPKIIFENNDIIVLDKPAGLLVHPTNKREKNTLVRWLLEKYPDIKNVGEDESRPGPPASACEAWRPGIVHRLDQGTSGLLVVAKNNKSFQYLKKQFADRKIIKKYTALVYGKVKDKKGIITKSISYSSKGKTKRTALLDNKSKSAWTEYKVVKEYQNYSLLEAAIKTGRTHQIRVHLASIGHPIAGDQQYKFKRQTLPKGLNRQFLHAKYLKFLWIDGKIMKFKSDLPDDLKNVAKQLK